MSPLSQHPTIVRHINDPWSKDQSRPWTGPVPVHCAGALARPSGAPIADSLPKRYISPTGPQRRKLDLALLEVKSEVQYLRGAWRVLIYIYSSMCLTDVHLLGLLLSGIFEVQALQVCINLWYFEVIVSSNLQRCGKPCSSHLHLQSYAVTDIHFVGVSAHRFFEISTTSGLLRSEESCLTRRRAMWILRQFVINLISNLFYFSPFILCTLCS